MFGRFAASAHHRRLTGYLTVHTSDRFKPTHTHLRTNELAFDHELIARLHDALEAGIVNTGKIKEALFAHFFGNAGKRNDGTGLSQIGRASCRERV